MPVLSGISCGGVGAPGFAALLALPPICPSSTASVQGAQDVRLEGIRVVSTDKHGLQPALASQSYSCGPSRDASASASSAHGPGEKRCFNNCHSVGGTTASTRAACSSRCRLHSVSSSRVSSANAWFSSCETQGHRALPVNEHPMCISEQGREQAYLHNPSVVLGSSDVRANSAGR